MKYLNPVNDVLFHLQIRTGYLDDERNTDNAWLENTLYNYHEKENVFSRYLLSVSNNTASKYQARL